MQSDFNNMLNGSSNPNAMSNMQVGMDGTIGTAQISLNDIAQVILRNKYWILGITLLCASAIYGLTLLIKPLYQSTSTLLLSEGEGGASATSQLDILLSPNFSSGVDNELELIRSTTLAARVANRIVSNPAAAKYPVLYTEEGKREANATLVAKIRAKVTVTEKPKTTIVGITVESESKDEARGIANLYVDEYLKWRLKTARKNVSASKVFLETQQEDFSALLKQSEDALESYTNAEGMVAPDEEGRLLVQQISELENERDRTNVDLGVAEATLTSLRAQIDRASPGLRDRISSTAEAEIGEYKRKIADLSSAIQTLYIQNPQLRGNESQNRNITELINQFNTYQRKLNSVADEYWENNRNAIGATVAGDDATGIKAQLGYINDLRRQMLNTEVQVSGIRARQKVVNVRLGELQGKYGELPSQAINLEKLKRGRDHYAEISKYITNKLNEAQILEQSKVGSLEVVDTAPYPASPVYPNKKLNLAFGLILGLLFGLVFAFVRNAVDQKIRRPEDLKKKGMNILGVIPTMEEIIKREFKGRDKVTFDGQTMSTALSTLLSPLAPSSEAYRRLRANIDFSRLDKQLQTLVITSAAPGEGKSITAMNLAIAMAQSGRRTIYIDADLRRPSGHKMLEMPKEPGLVDTLFEPGIVNWEQFATRIDDFYVMPAGSSVPNPAELMGAKKMRELILQLRNEFDIIIFDTPPVLSVTDGLLLSSLVDACIIVVSAAETTWQGIDRTTDVLKGVGATIAGLVLNRFDPNAAYGYSDYYNSYGYTNYKHYYTHGSYGSTETAKAAKDKK